MTLTKLQRLLLRAGAIADDGFIPQGRSKFAVEKLVKMGLFRWKRSAGGLYRIAHITDLGRRVDSLLSRRGPAWVAVVDWKMTDRAIAKSIRRPIQLIRQWRARRSDPRQRYNTPPRWVDKTDWRHTDKAIAQRARVPLPTVRVWRTYTGHVSRTKMGRPIIKPDRRPKHRKHTRIP